MLADPKPLPLDVHPILVLGWNATAVIEGVFTAMASLLLSSRRGLECNSAGGLRGRLYECPPSPTSHKFRESENARV